MSQSVGGATTNYVWDEQSANGDIVAETNASGAVQASYAVANGEALAQTLAGATSYSLPDGQGSLRALTNSSGAITDTFRYDAFGNLLGHTGTTSSAYGYDSQRFDAASGLYQLRARSYDPTTGRFLARDPATGNTTDPAQLDRYVYAAADPIMQSDPSGQSDLSEYAAQLMRAVIAVAGAAGIGLGGQVVLALGITLIYALLPEEVALPLVAWIGVGIIAGSVAYDTIQQELAIYSNLLSSVGTSGSALGGGSGTPSTSTSIGGNGFTQTTPTYLYHYTLRERAYSILLSGVMWASNGAVKAGNAAFGDGQYFTDMPPWVAGAFSMQKFTRALWMNRFWWGNGNRLDVVAMRVNVSGLPNLSRVHDLWSHTYDQFGHFGIYLNRTSSDLPIRGRTQESEMTPVDFHP